MLAAGAPWPLALLLALQAALSLRLVWSNTAFPDEALYLWAGRLELTHLLHGGPALPDFASYFSGAPVAYPPLAAAAAGAGGLAGARLLSLAMMLGATTMLHGVTRCLFDRRAAFLAAGLFAGLAATQFLGAFATYDAAALLLLAVATRLAVAAAAAPGGRGVMLAAAAAAALALANMVKYASGLFDPVVLVVGAAAAWQARGRPAAIRLGAMLSASLTALLIAALAAGGRPYLRAISSTTVARRPGSYPVAFLLFSSGRWLWPVALLAGLGVLAAATSGRGVPFALLAAALGVAVLLAPAEQASIHTYTSLFKHVGYGAWFGCAAAGYALAALSRLVPQAKAAAAFRAGAAAVLLAAVPAIPTAGQHFRSWPDTTRLTAVMSAVIAAHRGPILADDDGDLLEYYLGRELAGVRVAGTWYFSFTDPVTGIRRAGQAAYADAIRRHYFAVVMLQFWDNAAVDAGIARDLAHSRYYRPLPHIGYTAAGYSGEFVVFVRRGPS
jgi:hypothetical protein